MPVIGTAVPEGVSRNGNVKGLREAPDGAELQQPDGRGFCDVTWRQYDSLMGLHERAVCSMWVGAQARAVRRRDTSRSYCSAVPQDGVKKKQGQGREEAGKSRRSWGSAREASRRERKEEVTGSRLLMHLEE